MRGRKAIVAWVLFIFLLGLASPAGAVPFGDVDKNHWAARDISKMYAKGVVAGYGGEYRPNESISREQAVVMLVRIMGLAGETGGQTLPITFRNPEEVTRDFQPTIALAVNKGIVSGGDLLDFRPKEAAKRYEIAVFIARAMGYDAGTGGNTSLPFIDAGELNDWAPWAAPYVYYVYDQGIMGGDVTGAFRPLDEVTRAEMAALLARIDARVMKLTGNTVKGEVSSVSPSANIIWLKDGKGQTVTVPVADSFSVYKDNKEIALQELQAGDKLEVINNSQGHAVYIEVIPADQFVYERLELAGTVEAIQGISRVSLTVKTATGSSTYTLDDNVDVTVDGLPAEVEDILVGQEVVLVVEGDSVVEVTGRNVERSITGWLEAVTLGLNASVTVTDSQNRETVYRLADGARIRLDGSLADLEDLVSGQKITATVLGGEITRLEATSFSDEIAGTFVRAEFAPVETVVVSVETAKDRWSELAYEVDKDVKIRRDGRRASLRELVPGDEVEIELRNGKVIELYAEKVELETEGRIVALTLSYTPSLTIVDSKGQERTFSIASDATLRRDRRRIDVEDLKIDDYVTLEVEGQYIVRLEAEDRIINDYLIGTISEINDDNYVLVLEEPEANTRFGVGIYVDEYDTRIIKFGDDIRFRELEVGDRIIAVGIGESYRFLAETIVVISAAR